MAISLHANVSGDTLYFYVVTTRFDTGNATDADAVPAWRIYRQENGTAVANGTMALLDSGNTAGFYSEAVSLAAYDPGQYALYVAATVNSVAGAVAEAFTVGMGLPGVLVNTTIASLASQTSFTLTGGPAEDDVLNGSMIIVRDVASVDQFAVGLISDYTGASKTVTLAADPGIFTMATGDFVEVLAVPRQLPRAAEAGAANGLLISGSNAGTTTLGALTVTGATTLTGAVSLGSTLGITGTTTLAAVTATGTVTLDALTVSNNLLISGTTTFTGAITATAANDIRGVLLQAGISVALAELTGDPGATPTGAQALMLPYMAIRNKRDTTATDDEIHNNAGAVILTAALSDDTVTFTKGKYA